MQCVRIQQPGIVQTPLNDIGRNDYRWLGGSAPRLDQSLLAAADYYAAIGVAQLDFPVQHREHSSTAASHDEMKFCAPQRAGRDRCLQLDLSRLVAAEEINLSGFYIE